MNKQVKKMVGISLFMAIVVVLQFLGGGIKFGMFSISLVLVPIVVGAALYGWQAGGLLGVAFGTAVLLSGDASPFLVFNPIATVGVVLMKGIMCGFVSGIVYHCLNKKNQLVAVIISAIFCPIVNTGIFLIGCKLFFMPLISEWALALGFANAGRYMIFGLAGVNFLIECGVNIVLSPVIVRLIKMGKKV